MAKTERADLVVVGAGMVGGWASWFAATSGAERVVYGSRSGRPVPAIPSSRRAEDGSSSPLTEDPALMEPTALLCGSGERRNERARLARR